MPRENRPVITSSVDGEELPESTEPVLFIVDAEEYELYLSDEQRAEFDELVDKFTALEEPRRFVRVSKTSTPAPSTTGEGGKNWLDEHVPNRDELVEWFESNRSLFSDEAKFASRGRVQKQFQEEIEALASVGKVPAELFTK